MNISTVIPVCIENISQLELLNMALNSVSEQSLLPEEVIIADNSVNRMCISGIKELIKSKRLNIRYFSNSHALGAANNTNYAVSKTNSNLIHILHQDDYILNNELYERAREIFSKNDKIWLIAQGKVGPRIMESKFDLTTKFGFNELGGPSSLFVLKENYVNTNPNYRMLFDVVNYHEYFLKMGNPYIFRGVNIQFSVHEHQLSAKIKSKEVFFEISNFLKEYNISKNEIKITIKTIKREIYHQRILLLASFYRKKISFHFFIVNIVISYLKTFKRKIFN